MPLSWDALQRFEVHATEHDASGIGTALQLDAEQPFERPDLRVVVDQDRHHLTVQDVNKRIAPRDEMHLIPVADLHIALERVGIAEPAHEPGLLAILSVHHIAAPRDDAAAGETLVELTGEAADEIEIELIAA